MRIIHCADVHLDSAMTAHLDSDMSRERRREILSTFKRLFQYAGKNDVDAIIIAGDLFDGENASLSTVNVVLDEIESHPDIDVFYLRGNHDGFMQNTSHTKSLSGHKRSLEYEIASLAETRKIDNLHMFENGSDSWTYYETGNLGRVCIAGVVLNRDNSDKIYDKLNLREDDINIVVLHGQESEYGGGAKGNGTHPGFGSSNDELISLSRLRDKNIDYLALGHIHSYKLSRLDNRGLYGYSGCLEGRGFDECGEHGFVLIDIDEDECEVRTAFIPFAYRCIYNVEIDITGYSDVYDVVDLIADRLYTRIRGAQETSSGFDNTNGHIRHMEDNIVRVTLVGKSDIDIENDLYIIEKHFGDSFYYFEVKNCTKAVSQDINLNCDATLKGEFIRTVMATDLSDEDKQTVIRIGLAALAGEEVWPD